MRNIRSIWAFCLVFWLGPALAEGGIMLRADDLRAGAAANAAVIAKLERGTAVQILATQGGWVQVRHGNQTGWVRLLNVRRGTASQTDVAGGVAGVLALGTTRSDPNRVVATAGVRGLSVAELRAARFDAQQLERLERLGVSRAEAERFAATGKLAARKVDYLPRPEPAGQAAQGAAVGGGFDFMGGQ